MGAGFLTVQLFTADHALPVRHVRVLIRDGDGTILQELYTDENGLTKQVSLYAPDKGHVIDPYNTKTSFSIYDIEIPNAHHYKHTIVHGVQIFDDITSILPVNLHPEIIGESPEENREEIFIPLEHGVDMPRNMENINSENLHSLESNRTNLQTMQTMQANEVVIPEYITVHLGSPNAYARNVRVPFIDYIKNVASSEIFPNWEESALYANIYCQISFALNRIHTVWYRSRGFDFEITNSTAFDQYFVEGRNIFQNISIIVDGIFNNFIRRQGRREPFFAQYCNGTTSTCDGLSQWGSQDLALKGYTPMQILKYYYPNDIQIVESNNFTTNVGTYPGYPLMPGSSGADVTKMQTYLNRISGSFYIPAIPRVDGIFGPQTKTTASRFQDINFLVPDGIIGKRTWYAITKVYVAVTRLAELDSEGERLTIGAAPPTSVLQIGSRGEDVVELQFLINFISDFFASVPFVIQNGVFRDDTKRGVTEFQKEFKLTPDGVVGPATWRKLYDVYKSIREATDMPDEPPSESYPGTALRVGSRGENVRRMQSYLNAASKVFPVIPSITADGIFGTATQAAVTAFQRFFGLTGDGVIGRNTWDKIISVYSNLPNISAPAFPGTNLRNGSRGNDVILMQKYLNEIARRHTSIPTVTADGIFGPNTERAVLAFQRQFGQVADGIIGRNTWNFIVSIYNLLQTSGMSVASVSGESVDTTSTKAVQYSRPPSEYVWLLALNLMRK